MNRSTLLTPWLFRLFVAGLSLVAAASCSKEPAGAPITPAAASVPVAPAEVRLGYFANLTHAQAVLGVSSREFAHAVAPSKFETRVFNAGPPLIEALFAGEIDVGYVGPGPAINAFLKTRGKGIRVVAAAAANGVSIVVRGDSDIHKLADLAGKRIATPQMGNTQDLCARHFLIHDLKQPNADNIMPISNTEQAGMMTRGQIDAAWAPEPWAARLVAEAGARVLAHEEELWPGGECTLTLVVTTPEFLAAHPNTVEAILRVSRAWTQRLNREPGKYTPQLGDALLALSGKKLPPGVLDKAITRVKFTDEPLEETLATVAQWMVELGFARESGGVAGLVDASILKRLQGE